MYLAIDVGGSKTLIAVFNAQGQIVEQFKFPTSKSYPEFLGQLADAITNKLTNQAFTACCCALPGELDRKDGVALRFGNLPWKNVPIKKDLEKIIGFLPIAIENDAKLAGLSEALNHKQYRKALYLTVSTGIGDGIIIDGKIDADFTDSEPGQMVLEYNGKLTKWEDLASGRALVAKYGKRASEISDPGIWKEFSRGLARGMIELIATLQPDVIIIGGGVGSHFDKFSTYLMAELAKLENEMVKSPPIIQATRPEEAVIYGCYEFIRQTA
jgi:predicted NBD/HSP70 family sugar kinase